MSDCECPICFDLINKGEQNSITTDCNHTFHASCLMTNISKNGFSCPCCRFVMAVEDEEDRDSDSDSEYSGSGSESGSETDVQSNPDFDIEQSNLYQLQGLRWLIQRAEGEEIDEDEEEIENPFELEPTVEYIPLSPSFVSTSLKNNGVTYEDLVKAILYDHEDYERNENCRNTCHETWEKIHRIILNSEEMDTVD